MKLRCLTGIHKEITAAAFLFSERPEPLIKKRHIYNETVHWTIVSWKKNPILLETSNKEQVFLKIKKIKIQEKYDLCVNKE